MMPRTKGFTLVELVVVVLILGILAAIAAPKILTNSNDASDNGIAQTLATVRDAIDLYRASTGTGYPDGLTSVEIEGKLDAYLRGTTFPKVTVGGLNSNVIKIDTGDPPAILGTEGWTYNPALGEIRINSDSELSSQPGSGIKYSDL
ncbi:MAG: prepilin-type N-terminal cleavage/methylation domain-containing protein [Pirellulaceae bacterium]